jgi:hypothetical protein
VTPAEERWAAYLDAVEHAARDVEREALREGVPVLTPLPLPEAPWPATLESRRREVLKALETAQETTAVLAALPRPTRRRKGYGDGERVDVLG